MHVHDHCVVNTQDPATAAVVVTITITRRGTGPSTNDQCEFMYVLRMYVGSVRGICLRFVLTRLLAILLGFKRAQMYLSGIKRLICLDLRPCGNNAFK